MKKIKYLFQKLDAIWSAPLAFAVFVLLTIFFAVLFGPSAGLYDPGDILPVFISCAVVIIATNAAVMGMKFTFRGLHRYLYGEKDKDGNLVNYSKQDWLGLSPFQRYCFAFGAFALFIISILVIYIQFI